jgi:hypothetical protein
MRTSASPSPTEQIRALTAAHWRSFRLVKELLVAQELADVQACAAEAAIAAAIEDPRDCAAIDRAVRSVAQSEAADEDERRATERWARHVLHVYDVIAAGGVRSDRCSGRRRGPSRFRG